jgi:glycosyltransferase involved in cell wall biosynthesis
MNERPLRVMIIHGVGLFGGGSRSLYEAMRSCPEAVDRLFFVQRGSANAYYRPYGGDMIALRGITRFDNSRASYYRGARWLVPLRELVWFPLTLWGLWQAKQRWGQIDLIHVNEIMEILPGLIAKWLFGAPMIVHVRSLVWNAPGKWRVRLLNHLLRRHADAIVAIDENVRETLAPDLDITVIHNSLDYEHALQGAGPDPKILDRIPADAFTVGFLGNMHRNKGVLELVQAATKVVTARSDVHFLIIGSSERKDSGLKWRMLNWLKLAQEQQATFMAEVVRNDMVDRFHFAGHTPNILPWLERINVLAFPSHFDACGRPVFEAAFVGKPSIVAVSRPMPDTLKHGVTGIAIARPDPNLIAEAILALADDPDRVRAMGAAAQELAYANFTTDANAVKLLQLYKDTVNKARLARAFGNAKE